MATVIRPYALPSAMKTKLRQIRRRQVWLSAVRAAAIAASTLILAMLAAMVIDWWWTLFEPGVRTALTLGTLLAALAALVAAGVGPMLSAWRWTQAAQSADCEVPQLEERWTTVTSIAQTKHQPKTPAARAMLEQVTSEAAAMERLVQPGKVVRPASLRSAAMLLVGCGVALAGFLAIDWPQTSVLLRRFWSPRSAITATQLDSLTADVAVPRGEPLELVTRITGVMRSAAILELAPGPEIVDVLELKPEEERADTFAHRMNVDRSFHYRVRAGDGRTPWHTVTAIDYPALGEVQLTVTPPDYVDRPKVEKTLIPNRLKVIQGSRLELWLKPRQPLERLELALEFEPAQTDDKRLAQRLTLSPDGDGWYRFEMQLLEDLSLGPTLFNAYGLTNEEKHVCRIDVAADQAPVARIFSPTDEMVVAPNQVIDIRFEAHDDHGIAAAELLVFDESDAGEGQQPRLLAVQPIPLGEQELKQHVLSKTQLDLNRLGVKEGASISYAVRVTDNRHFHLDPDPIDAGVTEAEGGHTEDAAKGDRPAEDQPTRATMPQPAKGELPADQTLLVDAEEPSATRDGKGPQRPGTTRSADSSDLDQPMEASVSPSEFAARTQRQVAADRQSVDGKSSPEQNDSPRAPELTASSQGDKPAGDTANSASAAATLDRPNNATSAPVASDDSNQSNETDDGHRTSGPVASKSDSPTTRPRGQLAMSGQPADSRQDSETSRRKVKVVAGLAAVAAASQRETPSMAIRERVQRIDEMLSVAEPELNKLVEREISDAERSEQFRRLDEQLGEIEVEIASLRRETKEHRFAFVGLQMVDIGRTHIAPARERAFIGIREPLGSDNANLALQHVVRARELLAALLKRYDSAARDQQLAEALDDAVKMYEVYVEKTHQLMREARQNRNPLKRKMAVIEVDQAYLDRYAEVLTLRREMMAELARMLGDDPRLLARYLDLTKRRRASLRDQLTELAERQEDLVLEVSGWLQVEQEQRDALWEVIADMRLQAATPLAKDAAELAEGVEKQLPLVLESDRGTSASVVRLARQTAQLARQITFDAKRFPTQIKEAPGLVSLVGSAEKLVYLCGELDGALDQLNFEHQDEEEVVSYVTSRLLEVRTVADQADAWAQIAGHLERKRYPGLLEIDQQKLAIATELLRVEMLGIEADLQGEFQQQAGSDVPEAIAGLVRDLHTVMERITIHQAAATFALTQNRLEAAALKQETGVQEFERAEELLDKIRRAVIAALDEYDPTDPNIADLRDPTLDEFLAQLEREPNIEAQLGIPNRPRNLRVIADSMTWQERGAGLLGQSSDAAAARARQNMRPKPPATDPQEKPETPWTEEERQQRAEAQRMQESLEKSLAAVQAKAEDPDTSPQQRRQLEAMAASMIRMLTGSGQRTADDQEWERIAESDKAKALLKALARGQGLPDDQWNKLLSTLDDGLWQVHGRTPPENYRKSIEQYQETLRQLENGDAED